MILKIRVRDKEDVRILKQMQSIMAVRLNAQVSAEETAEAVLSQCLRALKNQGVLDDTATEAGPDRSE